MNEGGPFAALPASESERFNAWLEAQYQQDLERSPMTKTYCRIVDDDCDERDG